MATSISRVLTVNFAFADSTKRTVRFVNVKEDVLENVKTRLKAVKDDSDGSTYKYKAYLLSNDGKSTCTGIVGATVTETQKTPVYDSAKD